MKDIFKIKNKNLNLLTVDDEIRTLKAKQNFNL
jgi:hypothetical protein